MNVTKIPKKTISVIEPKRSLIVNREQYHQRRVAAYILKLLEKEAARECARRVVPTLDAILDFLIGLGLMALGGLGLAAACVVAATPDSFTRAAALLGLGFMAAVGLHRQKRK